MSTLSPVILAVMFVVFAIRNLVPAQWQRRLRSVARAWPTIPGDIDSVEVMDYGYPESLQVAKVEYSFSVSGAKYRGVYRRICSDETDANDFIMRIQVLPTIPVRYDPGRPARSSVLDEDVDSEVASGAAASAAWLPSR